MRYTAAAGFTETVSTMFGYVKKSDVERFIRLVVKDICKTDPEYRRQVEERLVAFVKKNEAATAQQAEQAKPDLPEAQKRPQNHPRATP